MSQPIHIVMTPTRNEAWVIRAFLESTTRWADYVIICDRFSTDWTREIVAEYAARTASLTEDRSSATDRPLALTEKKRAEVMFVAYLNVPDVRVPSARPRQWSSELIRAVTKIGCSPNSCSCPLADGCRNRSLELGSEVEADVLVVVLCHL